MADKLESGVKLTDRDSAGRTVKPDVGTQHKAPDDVDVVYADHPLRQVAHSDDDGGMTLLDPSNLTNIWTLPDGLLDSAKDFEDGYLKKTPMPNPTRHMKGQYIGGVTAKAFVPVSKKTTSGDPSASSYFMIKPFFEDFTGWGPTFYPLSGFSELTTQAMYHAAGIGHLNQRVIGFQQPAPSRKSDKLSPRAFLAIEMQPNCFEISPHSTGAAKEYAPDIMDEAAKIGVMDYLTNHQDRHGGNLLVRYGFSGPTGLLGVDNGRSFQYRDAQRHCMETGADHLFYYLGMHGSPAMDAFSTDDGSGKKMHLLDAKRLGDTLDWFKEHEGHLRDALEEQLGSFTDKNVAVWIRNNFNERCRVLHTLAELWTQSPDWRDYAPSWARDLNENAQLDPDGDDGKFYNEVKTLVHRNEHGKAYEQQTFRQRAKGIY